MREYTGNRVEEKLEKVVCNRCGKNLKVEGGCLKEGCFHGKTVFGYFSRKDGTEHSFDLCEDCYDRMTAEFAVPVEESVGTEML